MTPPKQGGDTTQNLAHAYYQACVERDEARQALWDVYRILGFDTDGDPTPAAHSDVEGLVVEAAKEHRKDEDEGAAEYVAEIERLREFACTCDHGSLPAAYHAHGPCPVAATRIIE